MTDRWIKPLATGKNATRFAVPGPVWSAYPQRVEQHSTRTSRQTRGLDVGAMAARALALPPPLNNTTRQQVLGTYWQTGLNSESCGALLQYAGAAIRATTGLVPRECQFEAAASLLNQQLAEMDTGEGKSLAVALAAAAAAMTGSPVHVMTSNDYLAGRDAASFAAAFERCGLSVSHVSEQAQHPEHRRRLYTASICYGTTRAFAFDYLRDRENARCGPLDAGGRTMPLLRGLCLAIVDEADSIFLDEANTPLVLSQPVADPGYRASLWQAIDVARRLQPGGDFSLNNRQVLLTRAGEQRIAKLLVPLRGYWLNTRYRREMISDALASLHVYREERDYIVRGDAIEVVDQSTGRAVPGRQFPGHLHGMIALIQQLRPPPRSESASGLTYPRFFARYEHLCGLSGTLSESARELRHLYGLTIHRVPRHTPARARRSPTRLFDCQAALFDAATAHAISIASKGRPVLIGTDSIAESAALARCFEARHRAVTLMNAANNRQEAQQIRQAGRAGAITIATQIAGRGTDIQLDDAARAAGGLHVLNLQHNRSARIDRQMSGRAARQGDPGSSEQWLRSDQHALQPTQMPLPVWLAFNGLCHLGLIRIAYQLVQRFWSAEDRLARMNRLRADRHLSKQLHFSSMANQ